MIFYGRFRTNKNIIGDCNSPRLDGIDLTDHNEEVEINCFWDYSEWSYDPETGIVDFRCKGVMVNDIYANGHLDMFRNAKMIWAQVYMPCLPSDCKTEFSFEFEMLDLMVYDDGDVFTFSKENLKPYDVNCEYEY